MADYRVIDADGHVSEPEDMWLKYLPEQYHTMAPRTVLDNQGRPRRMLAGQMSPYSPANAGPEKPRRPGGHDARARLKDMDKEGMDISVIYPSVGLSFGGVLDAYVNRALCRAYNDWVHDYCSVAPNRIIGIAAVPQMDIPESMAEAKRAVEKLGMRGVFLRPNAIAGRTLDHPAFEPLWRLIEDLDVPLTLHEGTTQNLPQAGRDRYENFLFRHVVSHAHEMQMGCLELICGGVLERHPRLRVAFLESGGGWIAYWLERLDHHLKYWGYASQPLKLKASEYFDRQGWISFDPDEVTLPGVISVVGDDNLLFASDYPHPDAVFPGVVKELTERQDITEQSKQKILNVNPTRLYGLT